MNKDAARRILAAARRLPSVPPGLSKLHPVHDAVVMLRARHVSYEKIAIFLKKQGIVVTASTIGYFVRTHCSHAEIVRARRSTARTGAIPMPRFPAVPVDHKIARDEL
ncbi:hypothetical protein [Geminisphaera colitermitum]|uniref:hypothetical protein n=1 Tax=Geminisphaera colitermitum TaxID=1148786 RepID=UPI0007DC0442|nr:hypothetical protein [Geminisphaera colitermitum]